MQLKITGFVHGVSFRASMREVARRHNVAGWVRNVADGSVEALIEGEEEDAREVLEWARRGPSGARVDSVHVETVAVGNIRGFVISG
jgi:acylphosphatase